MKRVHITDDCLVPSDVEGEMDTAYRGTVDDFDDQTAGLIVAAGRGRYVKRDAEGKFELERFDATPAPAAPAAAAAADKSAEAKK